MYRKEPRAVKVESDDASKALVRKKQTALLWKDDTCTGNACENACMS